MFSKFLKVLFTCFCAFSFCIRTNAEQFEKCIGRISYMLDSTAKTATINNVFLYWEEDSKVFLPAFVEFNDELFKVINIAPNALKSILMEITEINIPHTILKTENNKKAFFGNLGKLDEASKATIEDFFNSN